jgi:hypothetical protein
LLGKLLLAKRFRDFRVLTAGTMATFARVADEVWSLLQTRKASRLTMPGRVTLQTRSITAVLCGQNVKRLRMRRGAPSHELFEMTRGAILGANVRLTFGRMLQRLLRHKGLTIKHQ